MSLFEKVYVGLSRPINIQVFRYLRSIRRNTYQPHKENETSLETAIDSVISSSDNGAIVLPPQPPSTGKKPISKSSSYLLSNKKQGYLKERVTEENQYVRLTKCVTPLCKYPYSTQLKMKLKHMQQILQAMTVKLHKCNSVFTTTALGLPCPIEDVRPSPEIFHYRNKDEYSIHRGVDGNPKTVGMYVGRLTDPMLACVSAKYLVNMRPRHNLCAEHFEEFIRKSKYDACLHFKKDNGIWRLLCVRSTQSDELMACVYIHPRDLTSDEVQEIKENIKDYFIHGPGAVCAVDSLYMQSCNKTKCPREESPFELIYGKEFITETCLKKTFQISPDSFFQVNTPGAEVLYETVREVSGVSSVTTLLDICCGTGTVSVLMAPHVRGTIGIDCNGGAINDAQANAHRNNISNAEFIQGKVEKVFPQLLSTLAQCTEVVAVVNPSRKGLHPDVIDAIRQCEVIRKLVYVSCKPEGGAMFNSVRLCTQNPKHGAKGIPFTPRHAVPVDLFPHTNHCELVMMFERV